MSSLTSLKDRIVGLDLERALGLRPPVPPVAIQFDRDGVTLVRLKPARRGKPLLEAIQQRATDEPWVPASIFEQPAVNADQLARELEPLFERSGTRPGRIALVLPDNLAKIALINLPERPASRHQLEELVRARIRRGVPFRLDESSMSYQVFGGAGRSISVLVVLARHALVELYERALEQIGARVGLVDLCTPNLLNLCREELDGVARSRRDVALLNCDRSYFSLAIVSEGRPIFFRCKTYPPGVAGHGNGQLLREIAHSFSYYEEKLGGRGVGAVLLRGVGVAPDELMPRLSELGLAAPQPVTARATLDLAPGIQLAPEDEQRLAPVLGAVSGRG